MQAMGAHEAALMLATLYVFYKVLKTHIRGVGFFLLMAAVMPAYEVAAIGGDLFYLNKLRSTTVASYSVGAKNTSVASIAPSQGEKRIPERETRWALAEQLLESHLGYHRLRARQLLWDGIYPGVEAVPTADCPLYQLLTDLNELATRPEAMRVYLENIRGILRTSITPALKEIVEEILRDLDANKTA